MCRVYPIRPVRNLKEAIELADRHVDPFVTDHGLYIKEEDTKG